MNLSKSLSRVLLITGTLLLVPLTAMRYTSEVNWTGSDFAAAGLLLTTTGMALELVASRRGPVAYRLGAGAAVLVALLQIWVNLAVGFYGSGPNEANLLCGAIPFLGLLSAFVVRFRARGLARVLAGMAIGQLLVPVVAALLWDITIIRPEWIGSAMFAALWLGAAGLFQRAATSTPPSLVA